MKKLIAVLFCLCVATQIFAGEIPTKALKGKVFDKNTHEALAGVKVSVDNSNQYVYTDLEGNFTLLVTGQEKPVLTLSALSYNEVKIPVTNSQSDITAELTEL